MKIVLTKDEVADVCAAYISTIVDQTVPPHEIDFDRYGVDEFAVWESKKEPKDTYM